MKINEFRNITSSFSPAETPPVLFIGHGNPMNAITDNPYRKSWEELGRQMRKPAAVLCISAHWYTSGTFVTMNKHPRTIHDFGGFPDELFAQQYPAPGEPELAAELIDKIDKAQVEGAADWGLDHGAWSVLKPMFPAADVPVFQLSIDYTRPPAFHYELGKQLSFLRERGVLIVGSGNIVHNLRLARWDNPKPYDWAAEFDEKVKTELNRGSFETLVNYHRFGQAAELAVPTNEHYLPLLYALGAAANAGSEPDEITVFNEAFDLASISMTSAILR